MILYKQLSELTKNIFEARLVELRLEVSPQLSQRYRDVLTDAMTIIIANVCG